MKHTSHLKDWFSSFIYLLFPRSCMVCGGPLMKDEDCICTLCNMELPRTYYHLRKDNPVEQLFWGKIPLGKATSYFFYRKGSDFCRIIHQLKYGGQKEIGEIMGRYMAKEMIESGFFLGIDLIIPVPLHKKKQQLRGYNQSEWIAKGVKAVTGIPIGTGVVERLKNTDTQTRKSAVERWDNMGGVFQLKNAEMLVGKHVLLIDDVLTTGATTVGCATSLMEVESITISVLTLAVVDF